MGQIPPSTLNFISELQGQGVDIGLRPFIINLILAGLLGYLLQIVYERCGRSLSNRKEFGGNFVMIAMTTMIIITIVKSSLALSLGLVGALSIVRFRAAIKEPEELVYLFLSVAIGLGFGASQGLITAVGFVIVVLVLWLKQGLWRKPSPLTHLNLVVSSSDPSKIDFTAIKNVVDQHTSITMVQRLDDSNERVEAAFAVGFESAERLEGCSQDLRALGEEVKVSFINPRRLGI